VTRMRTAAVNHIASASTIHSCVMTSRLSAEIAPNDRTTWRVGRAWATPHMPTRDAAR
jgi:hypothetical protein